jgi:hypothetical protein
MSVDNALHVGDFNESNNLLYETISSEKESFLEKNSS